MGSHTRNALTVKRIEASKGGKLRDGGGLWLVTKGNGRYWILNFTIAGKRRELGLGPLHTVSLAEARERAEAARSLVRQGIDPINQRREVARARAGIPAFGEYADSYVSEAVKAGRWRGAKTESRWRNIFANHAAPIRDKAISDIGVADVLAVVRPLWGVKQETAQKVREAIERVLDAAKVEGLRAGDNPATWKGNLEHVLHKPDALLRGHHEALHYNAVPEFMSKLRQTVSVAARALEFLILTATRSAETRLAEFSEFDLKAGIWTIPAERTKQGRAHRVALSARAIEIVESLAGNGLVFPSPRKGTALSDMVFRKVIEAHGGGSTTAHGFRSSFRDWAGDKTDFPRELAEAALGHAVGDAVERAYRRGDALARRRKLMDAWSRYCAG